MPLMLILGQRIKHKMTLVVFLIYFLILLAFTTFTVLVFYHIGRYSYIGDGSKRVFFFYAMSMFVIVVVALILLIINQLVI